MKNIEQFLFLAVESKIIDISKKEQLLEFFDINMYNSDLYKDKLFFNILTEIFSFAEAQDIYNLSRSTLHKNIDYGRYLPGEIKQSGGTWLITKGAMERLYPSQIKYSKRFYRFLLETVKYNIINEIELNKIIDLFIKEYPYMDIYKREQIDLLRIYNDYDEFFLVNEVMTFAEAAEAYNISKSTLRKNLNLGKYIEGDVRKSKSTWLITKDAMKRLYGK
ncbi:MAG: hypothetical protein GX265_03810 [Mollicutes bacterium]|nr:hypothetical protein [Mollicutes bacterium]